MTDFEINLIKDANKDLQAELKLVKQQRDAALMKLGLSEEEIKVVGVENIENGGLSIQLKHSSLELFAISLVDSFATQGAINFSTVGIVDPRTNDIYEITMQKVSGKTPQMLFQESKQRIAELEATIEQLQHGAQ